MKSLQYFSQIINADSLPKNDLSSVSDITTVVFGIFGAIAVIIVIYSGIQLIISQGNSEKVAQARRGVIYSIVGLIVIAVAQVIVLFVEEALTK
jgi:hypothetical protein